MRFFARNVVERALACGFLAGLLFLPALPPEAAAQSQGDTSSVAEAARRAREQKKNAAKPARTLTNDDLPAAPAAAAPALQNPDPAGKAPEAHEAAPAGTPAAGPQNEDDSKKRARIEAAIKKAKAELAETQGELDVLERKAVLDSDEYYGKTDYDRDTEGKARLEADKQQIGDKRSRVDQLKSKLAALQAELGEAPESEKPAPPPA